MLASEPVRTLGAFQAHDSTLQSYRTLASPFESVQRLTHFTDTDIDGEETIKRTVNEKSHRLARSGRLSKRNFETAERAEDDDLPRFKPIRIRVTPMRVRVTSIEREEAGRKKGKR